MFNRTEILFHCTAPFQFINPWSIVFPVYIKDLERSIVGRRELGEWLKVLGQDLIMEIGGKADFF